MFLSPTEPVSDALFAAGTVLGDEYPGPLPYSKVEYGCPSTSETVLSTPVKIKNN